MSSFKIHFSLIFTLLIISFSFQFNFFITELTKSYEFNLNKDYSVVVVSKTALNESDFQNIQYFKVLSELSAQELLDRIKKDISKSNLDSLKAKLPKFYSLGFNKFISENEVKSIKKELLKIPNILKVETFSKTHIKVYKLLNIIKLISLISLICISFLSFAVFLNQVKILKYEHENKIYILSLFGAGFLQRAAGMLKIIFYDNLVCSALSLAFFLNFNHIGYIKSLLARFDIEPIVIDFTKSVVVFSGISLAVSLLCVLLVMLRIKRR